MPFKGHKSAVTTLAFDGSGDRLASGAKDTHVIVWDVVNECGMFRLKGHKGPVTRLRFMEDRNILVSSSKDTFIKFWDLDIQHCFSTLTGHLTEVWDFALVKEDRYVITGSSDSELRVFRLTFKDENVADNTDTKETSQSQPKKIKMFDENDDEDDDEDDSDDHEDARRLKIEKLGSILRTGQGKVAQLALDLSGRLLTCHGADSGNKKAAGGDNTVECFLICSPEEVAKRLQKKAKKERRKIAKNATESGETVEDSHVDVKATIKEEFRRLEVVKAGGRVKRVEVSVSSKKNTGDLTLLTANNMIQQFRISLDEKSPEEFCKIREVDQQGHRSDIRTVIFSSDNTAVMTGSQESIKIWSRSATVGTEKKLLNRTLTLHISPFFSSTRSIAMLPFQAGIVSAHYSPREIAKSLSAQREDLSKSSTSLRQR